MLLYPHENSPRPEGRPPITTRTARDPVSPVVNLIFAAIGIVFAWQGDARGALLALLLLASFNAILAIHR